MDNPLESQMFDWTQEDETLLRQFLQTRTGTKFLPKVAEIATPTLFSEGDTNKILVRSGEVRGVQLALSSIYTLAYPAPEPPKETPAYPPLEANEFWPETEKLN